MKKAYFLIVVLLLLQPVFLSAQFGSGNLFSELDNAFAAAQSSPTPEDEYYLGRAVAANILAQYRPYNANPNLTNYLNLICRTLVINAPNLPPIFKGYSVIILDSPEFNAFATPGGHILITKGMIDAAPSEEALAGIIAHELAHIMLRHGMKLIEDMKFQAEADHIAGRATQFSGNANTQRLTDFRGSVNEFFNKMVKSGYAVPQENEADNTAVALLAAAGYNPRGLLEMLTVLQRLQGNQRTGLFGTHPSLTDRIRNVQARVNQTRVTDTSASRQARFQQYTGRRSS